MSSSSGRAFEVFTEAVQLPIGEQAAFLDRACAGEEALRQKVQALLKSSHRAGDFLEKPPSVSISDGRAKLVAGEKSGDRIGPYRLIRQLGEGGCGVVFMAEQQEPVRRLVALKILKPGMDTRSVIARFEAERQALALMDHPHIARIFDAGTTQSGRPFFVMELVNGMKITEYCDENSLTTEERLTLFVQVCRAIQHAHQKGVIHRDIKPSNILVAKTNEGAQPVVIDFGIAKATADQKLTDQTIFTAIEMLIGTPAYMSPEQADRGTDVDTRADIYSLGVLLYELLTGSTPFDSGSLMKSGLDEIRRVIREREPDRPSTRLKTMATVQLAAAAQQRHSQPPNLIRSVRGDLDWIVMKALEKDRSRRYETANGLALDIERHLANEAISARPPSKIYKLRKTVLRNKILFASAGTMALLLVVSLIVVSLALARQRQASVKSQQVTRFLEEMLKGVGPSVAMGDDTKLLKRILDQTAERVGKEITDQPIVEAELLNIIGNLYGESGYPGKGEELVRRALAIYRQEIGSESLEAAASLHLLGLQFMGQHKRPEAVRAYTEALEIRRRLLGGEHEDTARLLSDLAAAYGEEGRVAEAEAMVREAIRIRRRIHSTPDLLMTDALRNLCLILGKAGRWTEAEETAREILEVRRSLLGAEHPSVASALHDLAWTVNARKGFEEAQSLEAEAALMQEKLLGDSHPDVPKTLNSLGKLLGNLGDKKASAAVLKAVLSIQRKTVGDGNTATLETFGSLARVLQEEGKGSEAESVWREALSIGHGLWGNDHPDRLYALRGLAESLESQGKWTDATGLWRESLSLWRKRGGAEEQQSMYTLRRLGMALEASRNWPEAESIYREALSISRQKGDEDAEAVVDLDRVVRALMSQSRFGEAQQLLDGILTPVFAVKPDSVNLLVIRVNLMGRQGRWREAAADAALALESQPAEHYRYHTLAALLAMSKDYLGYQRVSRSLVTKFADTSNPYVAERIVQDCLLLPDSGADLGLMDKLADLAVTTGRDTDGFAYFQACKAMTCYRMGKFSEAINWGNKATEGAPPLAQAKACAVLAMAHWRLGQTNEARAALGKGNLLAPALSSDPSATDLGESWVAWLMARISLDEAAGHMEGASLP